jgi:hypothetical protein
VGWGGRCDGRAWGIVETKLKTLSVEPARDGDGEGLRCLEAEWLATGLRWIGAVGGKGE